MLASVSNSEVDDIIYLIGSARIPKQGYEKKVDDYFSEELQLPTLSFCKLSVTLPLNDIENALKITLRYADGFGDNWKIMVKSI